MDETSKESGATRAEGSVGEAGESRPVDLRELVEHYLDGVFLTEMEQGYVPFRWPVDSFDVPDGEHVLTVNLRGYEGHFGCASIRFVKSANGSAAPLPPTGVAVE